MKKRCFVCGESFRGRSDKKFCSAYCRSSYHNRIYAREDREMRRINNILRRNRRLLLSHLSDQRPSANLMRLVEQGFRTDYCTGYTLMDSGRVQYRCYEVCYEVNETEQTVVLSKAVALART